VQVIPVEGHTVIDPDTGQALPPEGADVPETDFWFRRITDGDVIRVIDDIELTPIDTPQENTVSIGMASQPLPTQQRGAPRGPFNPFRSVS